MRLNLSTRGVRRGLTVLIGGGLLVASAACGANNGLVGSNPDSPRASDSNARYAANLPGLKHKLTCTSFTTIEMGLAEDNDGHIILSKPAIQQGKRKIDFRLRSGLGKDEQSRPEYTINVDTVHKADRVLGVDRMTLFGWRSQELANEAKTKQRWTYAQGVRSASGFVGADSTRLRIVLGVRVTSNYKITGPKYGQEIEEICPEKSTTDDYPK